MDPSLEVQRFNELPSVEDFATQIEPRNVPAVFHGCVKAWKACSCWNPSSGGLDYLQERVGSSVVEAMLSKAAPVFYGDLRRHERVPLPFTAFISICKQQMDKTTDGNHVSFVSERNEPEGSKPEERCLLSENASQQLYLAQVPIMNAENEEKVQLESLKEDIQLPAFLETKNLASINLWMNITSSRSSTHYDPHHNLLCMIAGCKKVFLWPPSASPLLYPMPLYGEASNHSSVALENPDFRIHPRAERSTEYSQKVVLYAGDALFIPEGWFHQVDSDDLTIAVNFWWPSIIMSGMSEHMDAYYVRRILRRLVDKEMNQVLQNTCAGVRERRKHTCDRINQHADKPDYELDQKGCNDDLERTNQKEGYDLHELEPDAVHALHNLVSFVHDHVNVERSQFVQSTSAHESVSNVQCEYKKCGTAGFCQLEDDPVANTLWTLEPLTLQNIFLAMIHNFPRTLEALVLHCLSPVGAEVLTRKFDEMDRVSSEEDRDEFYRIFYGIFDDQYAAMDAILNGKELFAHQAFKNVMDQYLGVFLDGSGT